MIRSILCMTRPQVALPCQRWLRNLRLHDVSPRNVTSADVTPAEVTLQEHHSAGDDRTLSLEMVPQLSGREQRLAAILYSYSFTSDHVRKIIEHFRYKSSLYEFEPEVMRESVKFWIQNLYPDKSRRLDGFSNFEASDSRRDEITLRDTLAHSDPNLLLINPKMMEKRIKNLKLLGIFSGRKDLDWTEFNRKFYYLQHRVMEWLIDVHRDPFPTPHPCLRHAKVFELPYEILKSRFEFALKAGVKSPVAAMKEGSKKKKQAIDVQLLFLQPVDEYLKCIAPGVTEEEYYVFEQMVEEYPDEEDRIIREVTRLKTAGQTLVENERIELEDEEDDSDDSDSDEIQFKRKHKLTEYHPNAKKRVYKINFAADEEAARKRHEERLTKLSE